MQQSNNQTAFYVVSLNAERTKFSLVNYKTETPILLNVSREDVSLFLRDNEPSHPFLSTKMTGDVKDYLITYNLYNTSYQNPYSKSDGPSDFGSFSYVVSDNDSLTKDVTGTYSSGDSDPLPPSVSAPYRDDKADNDIPYISGRIGHSGD